MKEGDLVKCTFEWTDDYLIRRVRSVEKVKFKDLDNVHAWFEGYKHVDLLKHELQCIYHDIRLKQKLTPEEYELITSWR